jgi:hypothetical protein
MKRNVALCFGMGGLLLSHLIGVGCSGGGSNPGGNGDGDGDGDGDGTGGTMGDGDGDGTGGTGDGDGDGTGGTGDGDGDGTGGTGDGDGDGTGGTGDGDGDAPGGMGGMMFGGMGGMPETGPDPGTNYLENPGFESDDAWEESGPHVDASYFEGGGVDGRRLTHWREWSAGETWYEVRTAQTITDIPNGTYTFSMMMRGVPDSWLNERFLFAEGFDGDGTVLEQYEMLTAEEWVNWTRVEISGIEVTNNQITVGVYSTGNSGNATHFDDAALMGQ